MQKPPLTVDSEVTIHRKNTIAPEAITGCTHRARFLTHATHLVSALPATHLAISGSRRSKVPKGRLQASLLDEERHEQDGNHGENARPSPTKHDHVPL